MQQHFGRQNKSPTSIFGRRVVKTYVSSLTPAVSLLPPAHLSNPRQRVEETLDALPVRTISMHQIDILVIAVHVKPLACPPGDAAACATLVAAIL